MTKLRYRSPVTGAYIEQVWPSDGAARRSMEAYAVTEYEFLSHSCGFPQGDFHFTDNKTPCGVEAVEEFSISTPDGRTITVPVCGPHYYTVLKLFPRDLVELIKNNQLDGVWSVT